MAEGASLSEAGPDCYARIPIRFPTRFSVSSAWSNSSFVCVAVTIVLCAFIPLFARARFSFGYFAGISFYSMIIGFFWYTYFTHQRYDHALARWSAVASLLMFLIPALFQTMPAPRALMLSP